MIKQIIVVRKDLNMRKGKIAAQAAHASMKVVLDLMEKAEEAYILKFNNLKDQRQATVLIEWLSQRFTKIVVGVNSEAELLEIYEKAKAANLLSALILDSGATEFHGQPTYTCCAIGPDEDTYINPITQHLSLL